MDLQPHQQRVVDEKAELDERLTKLRAFGSQIGGIFDSLPTEEKQRLTEQEGHIGQRVTAMKIEIIYFNAGGGHRAAAKALELALTGHQVLLTNLFEVIDAKKLFKRLTGHEHEDLYNKVLASGWTIGLGPQLKVLQAIIRSQRRRMISKLKAHWALTSPDMVVSVIPNFNRALGESLGAVPFCTLLTDMVDYPPGFWVEPKLKNQQLICGFKHAVKQARAASVPSERLHLVSGMILRPEFYKAAPSSANSEPVGFVMFGGIGSKEMVTIAKLLADRQLILVCGKNAKVKKAIDALNNPKHQVLGFATDIPALMAACDYFIGKPGPGSISEAIQMRLPVIVSLNAWTMPQERWNAEWVSKHELGLVVKNYKRIAESVDQLLSRLPELKQNVAQVQNRALFEIPQLLTDIYTVRSLT